MHGSRRCGWLAYRLDAVTATRRAELVLLHQLQQPRVLVDGRHLAPELQVHRVAVDEVCL